MITKLKAELLTGTYDGLSDQQAADALNAPITEESGTLASGELYNAIDPTEFTALTDTQKQLVRDLFSLGSVNVSAGKNARTVIMSIFGAGTATRDALVASITVTTTRAKQIGFKTEVPASWVTEARK